MGEFHIPKDLKDFAHALLKRLKNGLISVPPCIQSKVEAKISAPHEQTIVRG